MKKVLAVLVLINFSLYANDINIGFGCYDCDQPEEKQYNKEPQKFKEKSDISKMFESIEISGQVRLRIEEENKK